jgi:catalase
MASSSHNGKSSHAPATPAGSPEAVQEEAGEFLATAQGLRPPDTDHSLKAGQRGPTLMEDFHLREKITHFDHERIPKRVVHARGRNAPGPGPGVRRHGLRRPPCPHVLTTCQWRHA